MKQARLAAGWLMRKKKLLPVLIVVIMVCSFSMPALVMRAAAITDPGNGGTADALWADNYKTLVYNGDNYTGPNQIKYGNGTVFIGPKKTADGCNIGIVFSGNYKTAATAQFASQQFELIGRPGDPLECAGYSTGTTISVNSTPSNPAAGPAGNSSDGSTDSLDPCDASGNVLSWFVCPVIDMINQAVIQMQHIIDHLMAINVGDVFDTTQSPGKNYYAAWNSFRTFGVVLIVIAGLIMVISQALGFEIFDAYTVKKVLPRLLVTAIGISLSWWLLMYLAEITNDLGLGIRGVIYYPFRNMGNAGLQNTGSYILTIMLGAGTLFAMTMGGVFLLVLTAVLAALVAFLVLVIRQILLIFLIILAPLAIACYILPNTEKAYKLWWDSTFKGMLMFPIISGFIAVGRVFSVVASNASGGAGSSINQVMALIAFFLPYFALPFTFRLAGGAIATIGGLANDRSRGAFDMLKKGRANLAAQGWARKRNGNMFMGGNENNIRGKINRGVANTINTPAAISASGATLRPDKWRRSVRSYRSTHEFDHAMEGLEKDTFMRAIAPDDDLLSAGLQGGEREVRSYLQRTGQTGRQLNQSVASVMAAKRSMGDEAFNIAAAAALPGTKTGFAGEYDAVKNPQGLSANQQMDNTIASVSHGDKGLASRIYASARSNAGRAGRLDLAGHSFGSGVKGVYATIDGGTVDNDALNVDAFLNNDAVTIGRSDSRAVRNIMDSVGRRLQNLDVKVQAGNITATESEELGRLTGAIENFRAQGYYFAPQRVETVERTLRQTDAARQSVKNQVEDSLATPAVYDIATRTRIRNAPAPEGYIEQKPEGPGPRGGRTTPSPDDPRIRHDDDQ